MFQRQIFWMSYLPLPKCKFATNLHHICYKQSRLSAHEKINGMWEAVPHKHLSCVLQHQGLLRASCKLSATKPQVWDTYSKGNSPSQSKLQVCCKCSCKKTKGHIGAPEYHNYEWKTCWIIFRHSLQVHCFILCQNYMMFLFVL